MVGQYRPDATPNPAAKNTDKGTIEILNFIYVK
jgi:hypothetical protein